MGYFRTIIAMGACGSITAGTAVVIGIWTKARWWWYIVMYMCGYAACVVVRPAVLGECPQTFTIIRERSAKRKMMSSIIIVAMIAINCRTVHLRLDCNALDGVVFTVPNRWPGVACSFLRCMVDTPVPPGNDTTRGSDATTCSKRIIGI